MKTETDMALAGDDARRWVNAPYLAKRGARQKRHYAVGHASFGRCLAGPLQLRSMLAPLSFDPGPSLVGRHTKAFGYMAITAILFDIDGTLVDSNDFHVEAWDEALRGAGYEFDRQTIHDQIGKGSDNFVPSLLPDLDEEQQEAIGEAHGKAFKSKFLDRVQPFPQAKELLERCHASGQTVVLASSASQEELDHYIDLMGVKNVVAATTSKDDAEKSKPAPDIFSTALKKLGSPAPDTVMVVGDTPYDIEAAAKCGLRTIGLLSGKFAQAELEKAGAVSIYDDVAALLTDYETSRLRLPSS